MVLWEFKNMMGWKKEGTDGWGWKKKKINCIVYIFFVFWNCIKTLRCEVSAELKRITVNIN